LIAMTAFHRIRLPRMAIVGGVLLGVTLVLVQPELRARNLHGSEQAVNVIDVAEETTTFAANKEIAAAAYAVDYTWTHSAYQYGAVFWDAQVNQWVPAGLFGQDLKDGLRIFAKLRDVTDNYAVWDRGKFFYIAQFGISDAFQQFGLLAGMMFFAIGYLFGRWYARRNESVKFYYLLAVYTPYLALAVGHGITPLISRWPIDLALLSLFGMLVRSFANKEKSAPALAARRGI
jgi:hypothetical protein